MMSPGVRKFVLTVHLTASVGWIGAVIAYLSLVFTAMMRPSALTLQTAWAAMALIGWYAIVPLALASWLTGIVQSLGTRWGLFRHYWVVISLVLTTLAVAVLLQHMPTVSEFAALVVESPDLITLRAGLDGELFHAGIGLVVLLIVQVLNIYKPQGLTPYGWRKQTERRVGAPQGG